MTTGDEPFLSESGNRDRSTWSMCDVEAGVRRAFRFLTSEFGFVEVAARSWGNRELVVHYRRPDVQVSVEVVAPGFLIVHLYKLKLPCDVNRPAAPQGEIAMARTLHDLVCISDPNSTKQVRADRPKDASNKSQPWKAGIAWDAIAQTAKLLATYGGGVLRGDFSVFPRKRYDPMRE